MKDLNLEKDKIYSIYVEVTGDEGYGSGFGEDWNCNYSGTIKCSKDVLLTDSLLLDVLDVNSHVSNVEIIKFVDVTDLVNELNKVKLEMDDFDWSKDYSEYDKLSDAEYELFNKINPGYICTISVEKTI